MILKNNSRKKNIEQDELRKKCSELSFLECKDKYDKIIMDRSIAEIEDLFKLYGYANVLSTMSDIWQYDVVENFFYRASNDLQRKRNKEIKTIAVFYYRGYLGGLERVNAELLNIWTKMGLRVVFFTEEPQNELDYSYPDSVKRFQIPGSDLVTRLNFLQKICTEEHVDVFINHAWCNISFLWDCLLMKMLGIYYVQYCHGHFSWSYAFENEPFNLTRSYELCDMIIAISKVNARFYQMCGYNTFLMQNPVPQDLPRNYVPTKNGSRHVLLVGRISEEKYPIESLQIFKKVHEKINDVVLDIVGDGDIDLLSEMKEYIVKNNLENAVCFHGAKNADEVAQFYRNSACVLFTSKMEGYPMIILETKSYGLPLVMYELPFLTLVEDGKGVLTAPIGDIKTMSDNLIALMTNDIYRQRVGCEAKESFDYFAAHNHVDDWKSIFMILCGDERAEENDNYYSNSKLSNIDSQIIPILLDKLQDRVVAEKTASIDYKIGRAILEVPRRVIKVLRSIEKYQA